MKILFTADLHLNVGARSSATGLSAIEGLAAAIAEENPAAVVIAGDIGIPKKAHEHVVAIRSVVGDRPLAIALGNHDFWLDSVALSQFSSLDQIVTRYWRDPIRDVGAVLSDRENMDLGKFAVVGSYGHFDLGLAEPGLKVQGVEVTEEIYLTGGMNGIFWNDFRWIPNCATSICAEAREQAAGIATRIDAAITSGKRVLVAVHTCPWRQLNGHPLSGDERDILSAYSGNSLVGTELTRRMNHLALVVCGHTHMMVREKNVNGILSLNLGADYGEFCGIVYETDNCGIRWIGQLSGGV